MTLTVQVQVSAFGLIQITWSEPLRLVLGLSGRLPVLVPVSACKLMLVACLAFYPIGWVGGWLVGWLGGINVDVYRRG